MKVHLFASENLYTFAYFRFLEKNFDISTSIFVFRTNIGLSFDYSDAVRERIIIAKSNFEFQSKIIPLIKKAEKFYFHQLPYGPSLLLWNFYRPLLSKSVWIIWGGDVYIHSQGKDTLKKGFYEFLRRRIIKRIPVIASFIPGDFEIVRKVYDSKAKYLQSAYPIPVDFMKMESKRRQKSFEGITILVGNSGNEINNHIEVLELISFVKDIDMRIVCPLSYSGSSEYINSVLATGRKNFGVKFEALMSFLGTDDYLTLLSETDIAIMNHERQQGLGNILPLLYFGKKVYLRRETTSYAFLKDLGCTIFDMETLRNNKDSFLDIDREELQKNREIISDLLSEKRYVSLWTRILE